MCRQGGMTLLCMCEGFSCLMKKQMIVRSLDEVTVILLI